MVFQVHRIGCMWKTPFHKSSHIWCYCCFLEQETLLTLLQSTQLFKWGPGGLVLSGEAAHPAVTSSKFPTVLVLLSSVGVVVELQVPRPLSVRPGQSSSCRLLGGFACTRLKRLSGAQASQCWSTGQQWLLWALGISVHVCACVRACVCVCVCV